MLKTRIYFILLTLLFCQQITFANIGLDWYNTVWEIVNNEFFDSTYNNQDWNTWKNKYSDTIKTEEDACMAIDTMLSSLDDKYTMFIPPTFFEEMNTSLAGKSDGIGITLSSHRKGLKIEEIEPNSPAEKTGLKTKDIILAINDIKIKKTNLDEVLELDRKSVV